MLIQQTEINFIQQKLYSILGGYGSKLFVGWMLLFSIGFQARYRYMSLEYTFSVSGKYVIHINLKFYQLHCV